MPAYAHCFLTENKKKEGPPSGVGDLWLPRARIELATSGLLKQCLDYETSATAYLMMKMQSNSVE